MTSDAPGLAPLRSALLKGVPHAFFTRAGGVSGGIYAGLNCGPGSADEAEAVVENRARAADALGVAPGRLVTLHQVHSDRVVRADGAFEGGRPEADGAVTNNPDIAVGALSADCAPILLADPGSGVVAAVHAGWKGALADIPGRAVDAMAQAGARRERIVAAVGPCISQRAYEVGPEFLETFLDDDPDNHRFFAPGRDDRLQFDLPGFVLARLRAAGIAEAEWIGRCTHADPDRFFSHRRSRQTGEPDYGRLLSAIRPPSPEA